METFAVLCGLLVVVVVACASTAHASNVFFAGSANNTVTISAPFLTGVVNVTIGGQPCIATSPLFGLVVDNCLMAITRNGLCGVESGINGQFSAVSCTSATQPCFNLTSKGWQSCAPSASPDMLCHVSGCIGPAAGCYYIPANSTYFSWQYTTTGYVGLECGVNMACNAALKCIPANPPQCPGTMQCVVSGTPPGVLDAVLVYANGSVSTLPAVVTSLEVPVLSAVMVGNRMLDPADVALSTTTEFALVWANPAAAQAADVTFLCASADGSIETVAATTFDVQADLVLGDIVSVSLFCDALANFSALGFVELVPGLRISALVAAVPVVYTTCPTGIYAGLLTTVTVDGDLFSPLVNVTCVANGVASPGVYVSRGAVQCDVLWANETITSVDAIALYVSNDGITLSPAPASVRIEGSCGNIKPNSVPGGGGCECPPGYFDAGTYCQPCEVGTYQPDYNQRSCLACGADQTTAATTTALASPALCICKPGFYASTPSAPNVTLVCSACPPGFTCNGTAVVVNAGFWRASATQMETTVCPSTKQCPGGEGAGARLCAAAYKGPLCQVCRKGYGALGGECVKCPPDGLSGFMLFVVVAAVLAIVVVLVRATATFEFGDGMMSVTFKVAFAYFQILFYVGKLAARWSSQSTIFFSALVPVTLTPSFVAVQCASRTSFYTSIGVVMAFPAIAWVCIAAFYVARGVWIRRDAQGRSHYPWADIHDDRIKSTFVVWYLMHPVIAEAVIRSLRCVPVEGTGTTFLVDNPEVDCSSASYRRYYGIAWAYTVIYILGFIVYLLVHIYMCAPEVIGTRMGYDIGVGKWFVFFVRGYTNNHYLWEFMIVLRKLGVVLADSLLPPEVQLVWAGIAIGGSLAATIQTFPYEKAMVNYLDIMALSALFFTIVLGLHQRLLEAPDQLAVFMLLVLVNTTVGLVIIVAMFKSAEHIVQRYVNVVKRAWNDRYGSDGDIQMMSREGKVPKEN